MITDDTEMVRDTASIVTEHTIFPIATIRRTPFRIQEWPPRGCEAAICLWEYST